MGLYERLLEERAEEEQRRGGPLPQARDLDSKSIARRLEDDPARRPGYAADLLIMYRLIAMDPLDLTGSTDDQQGRGYPGRASP
jgi:hypothetical protein